MINKSAYLFRRGLGTTGLLLNDFGTLLIITRNDMMTPCGLLLKNFATNFVISSTITHRICTRINEKFVKQLARGRVRRYIGCKRCFGVSIVICDRLAMNVGIVKIGRISIIRIYNDNFMNGTWEIVRKCVASKRNFGLDVTHLSSSLIIIVRLEGTNDRLTTAKAKYYSGGRLANDFSMIIRTMTLVKSSLVGIIKMTIGIMIVVCYSARDFRTILRRLYNELINVSYRGCQTCVGPYISMTISGSRSIRVVNSASI